MEKSRDISILNYFNQLQVEYLLYDLRSKIFPAKEDKEKYKKVLTYKREKIEDISNKNNLLNIFNSNSKMEEIQNNFLNDFGVPRIMSNRDKYFYYSLRSDFSYMGKSFRLFSYNFKTSSAVLLDEEDKRYEVDINMIKRIL